MSVVYARGEVGVEDPPSPKILAPIDAILRFVRDLHLVGPGTLLGYRADRSSAADGPAQPAARVKNDLTLTLDIHVTRHGVARRAGRERGPRPAVRRY
jgi:hypothetical protein